MTNSDIFDSFIKIAKEKGLISEEEPSKKEEPSDDEISPSELLYGIKPYKSKYKNIIEEAHPTPSVYFNAHDKLNGLIENENERQNITLNIVNKVPNGFLDNHKYAEYKLLSSLIKLNNSLSSDSELKKLSNSCIDKISTAGVGAAAVGGIASFLFNRVTGVAAAIASLWVQQHLPFVNEGFENNHKKLIGEIDDILNSSSDWRTAVGAGYEYTDKFLAMVQGLKNRVEAFYQDYNRSKNIIEEFEKPKDAKDLAAAIPHTSEITAAYKKLHDVSDNMLPYIEKFVEDLKNKTFKAKQIKEKGNLVSILDRLHIFHSGIGLVADDMDDLVRALNPYVTSINEIYSLLNKAKEVEHKAQNTIDDERPKLEEKAKEESEHASTLDKAMSGFGDLFK